MALVAGKQRKKSLTGGWALQKPFSTDVALPLSCLSCDDEQKQYNNRTEKKRCARETFLLPIFLLLLLLFQCNSVDNVFFLSFF